MIHLLPVSRCMSGLIAMFLGGCIALPGGQVVDSALIVHTRGSSQDMVAVKIPIEASKVYAAFVHKLEQKPDITVVNRNDKAMLLEVSKGEKRLTGQVTELGASLSLLYIWADAGVSEMSGRELASSVVEVICDELGVAYEKVEY